MMINLKAARAVPLAMIALTALFPVATPAQSSRYQGYTEAANRQKNKNNWRNIAVGAGAVGLYGLLKGDQTVALLGAAGAAYSANRYEQDRHSQSQQQHDRDSRWRWHRRGFRR